MSTLSLQLVLTWIGVGACVGAAVGMVVSTVVILVVRVVVGAGVDVGPPSSTQHSAGQLDRTASPIEPGFLQRPCFLKSRVQKESSTNELHEKVQELHKTGQAA
jgi:hypothetical protein